MKLSTSRRYKRLWFGLLLVYLVGFLWSSIQITSNQISHAETSALSQALQESKSTRRRPVSDNPSPSVRRKTVVTISEGVSSIRKPNGSQPVSAVQAPRPRLTASKGHASPIFNTPSALSNEKFPEYFEMQTRLQKVSAKLENLQLQYYVYPKAATSHPKQTARYLKGKGRKFLREEHGRSVMVEIEMIQALLDHPLRSEDKWNADLYFVPASPGVVWSVALYLESTWNTIFGALVKEETWQKNMGHKHVMISTLVPTWSWAHLRWMRPTSLPPWYKQLWNMTIATNVNWEGCRKASNITRHVEGDFGPELFAKGHSMARSSISLGWIPSKNFSYAEATYEKFVESSLFIFYHCRETEFMNNSTIYRRAPLRPSVQKAIPKSSIGYDLEKEQWLRDFADSKFCLVVRGDIPHSHALLRAVKAGCIPVVVSDLYEYYAPTFRSSLNMRDFCIFIDEDKFVKDPARTLQELDELSEDQVQAKLAALRFAQRVVAPDHPKSLFVPAFLHETDQAQKFNQLPNEVYPYGSEDMGNELD